MKPVLLTAHARQALEDRRLEERIVTSTARSPTWSEADPRPGVERRFRAWPELGGRVLRVAVVETRAHIRVLSAHPDRDARPPDAP